MRYCLFVFVVLGAVASCSREQTTIGQPDDPIVGNWVKHVPAQGAIVQKLDFEIWTINGDKTFTRQQVLSNRCVGSNGIWEKAGSDKINIVLYPDTGMDSTFVTSYRLEGDELFLLDLGTEDKTIWRRTEEPPLVVLLEEGYCMDP